MNCTYCGEPCFFDKVTRNVFGGKEDEVWLCKRHPLTVEHYIHFIRKPNCDCGEWSDNNCCPKEEFYKVVMEVPKPDGTCYLAIFEDNNLCIQHFNGVQAWNVIVLDPVPPNLSPDNLARKIPLWVVFS